MPRVEIASGRVGALDRLVIAGIVENGDLHVTQMDSGDGASQTGADEDESNAVIEAADKDRLLLALLAQHYAGNLRAKHEIAKLATEHGIKVTSFHWP